MPKGQPHIQRKCCIPSCESSARVRGYCRKHYYELEVRFRQLEASPNGTITAGLMLKTMANTVDPRSVEPPCDPDHLRILQAVIVEALTPKQRAIIGMRYGLTDGYVYMLEEVGRKFRITRERVRQMEVKALRQLQKRMDIRLRHAGEDGIGLNWIS